MKVKVRAVIVRDGKLVVSRERRRGVEHVLLPGGTVQDRESITDALVREVREEIGLTVVPERLLYVAEVVGRYRVHDLNLVWLAEPEDPDTIVEQDLLVEFDSAVARSMLPPLAARIAEDALDGWSAGTRWLGNIRRTAEP